MSFHVVISSETTISTFKFSSRTYVWIVLAFRLMPNNRIMIEDFRTTVRPVLARVHQLSVSIIYSQDPGVQEPIFASWEFANFLLADITDAMSICAQYDRQPHILHTHWTLYVSQQVLFKVNRFRLLPGATGITPENSLRYNSLKIQGEHKIFPWLQTFITRKLRGIQTYKFFITLVNL